MKTYILRGPKPVEPQKSIHPPRARPAAPATRTGPVLFLGLDVHNDSIAVSRAPSEATEVRRYGCFSRTAHGPGCKLKSKPESLAGWALKRIR